MNNQQAKMLEAIAALEDAARYLRQASHPATWPEVDRRLFNRRVIDRRKTDEYEDAVHVYRHRKPTDEPLFCNQCSCTRSPSLGECGALGCPFRG